MASGMYNTGLAKLTGTATAIVWGTADTRCLLVKSGYTFNKDHDFVSDLTPASNEVSVSGYARQTMTGETKTTDDANDRIKFDADDVPFGALATGETIAAAVIYEYNAADASAQLIAYIDLTDTPTNGSTVTIQWHSDGIFYIG